ncbi:MAG TPA: Ig-like domain-containing protein, partial [Gemmatimonadales bacterium]|nr:Ig-like domain-containing protein [Gemmatimonadales bacterium]
LTAQSPSQPQHGTVDLHPDGSFIYTPDQDYSGADSFTYRASDGSLASAPATVTIGVQTATP